MTSNREKVVPYNTGKVKIGLAHNPTVRRSDMGLHAERLQTALLGWHEPWYVRMARLLRVK